VHNQISGADGDDDAAYLVDNLDEIQTSHCCRLHLLFTKG
jgi:hypothetical protein